MGGGQDKPAWTACPPGVKITRVGGKITRDSFPPGGQAVQGGKINCYTGYELPLGVDKSVQRQARKQTFEKGCKLKGFLQRGMRIIRKF